MEKFVLNRPKFWNELILKIKKLYKGKLTYAANWDEYKRIHFWNVLDYIGVDAYFPLTDKKSSSTNNRNCKYVWRRWINAVSQSKE